MRSRTAIWIGIVCAQLAFDVWVIARHLGRQEQPQPETRYVTQVHQGVVLRSQPRTGAVEVFNPKTREWVALGNTPNPWGDAPAR